MGPYAGGRGVWSRLMSGFVAAEWAAAENSVVLASNSRDLLPARAPRHHRAADLVLRSGWCRFARPVLPVWSVVQSRFFCARPGPGRQFGGCRRHAAGADCVVSASRDGAVDNAPFRACRSATGGARHVSVAFRLTVGLTETLLMVVQAVLGYASPVAASLSIRAPSTGALKSGVAVPTLRTFVYRAPWGEAPPPATGLPGGE